MAKLDYNLQKQNNNRNVCDKKGPAYFSYTIPLTYSMFNCVTGEAFK